VAADREVSRRGLIGGAALVALLVAAPAAASPYIHAHRGGPIVDGKPRFGENTMPAFRDSAARGFVLELDVKLTGDGVPVVFHDSTLDRVTDCDGRIDERTYAELRGCRVDILGTEDNFRQLGPRDDRRVRVPTLARVLDLLRRTGAHANIEIKNQPTDPDYDPTDGFARAVSQAIASSGVPPSNLIVQSFWPANLEVAEQVIPDVERSTLTLTSFNSSGPPAAQSRGYRWVSPQWPVDAGYIADAHSRGLEIVSFTLDDAAAIDAATRAGVDALISNDPRLARRVVRGAVGPRPRIPPPPTKRECRSVTPATHLAPQVSRDPAPRAPRVFAMQYKQELANVVSYDAFRTKIECMIREYVEPRLARGRPNVVAFNEDVGLATIATGSRGQGARDLVGTPGGVPGCEGRPAPCAAAALLFEINGEYARQNDAYAGRFPQMGPIEQAFVAPTDTFARGWMQVFSDMARRYDVYIVGSNNQAPFRESRDPSEIAVFADPDLQEPPSSVFVATEDAVYNEAFIWGPDDVREEGPWPLRNVVAQNKKVPLTELEQQLQVSAGPSSGPDAVANLRPYRLPGTEARLGIATSLPAFQFGHQFGEPPPEVDPCSDTRLYYMHCLDKLRANVVIQDEANPGPWAVTQPGGWQPLEWMGSSWRHVGDPSVSFAYNVTPFMVGNLADLVFDGQSSIAQRGRARGRGCNYVGTRRFQAGPPENDPAPYRPYAGRKREFLAVAPWVRRRGTRDELRAVAERLAPGSRDALENDYVETALIADLPFPVDRQRPGCAR
jgi:glycerophosphoryl diester phosphodiesterase